MPITVHLLLAILAVLLFVLAAVGVPSSRFSLVAAGLAAWCLSTILTI